MKLFSFGESKVKLRITDKDIEELNSKGYIDFSDDKISMHLTLNEKGQLVDPEEESYYGFKEQKEKVCDASNVVWNAYYNNSHPVLKVSHRAYFNNAQFFVGKAESGSFVMFHKVVGKLNDNIVLKDETLQGALREAAEIALELTK